MTYGQKYFCWKYNKVLKCPTIICTLFKNPKGGEIATPLEFLDIPMGQKYPSTLNPKAASLMINKTKAHPHCHMDFVAFLFYFIITSSLTPSFQHYLCYIGSLHFLSICIFPAFISMYLITPFTTGTEFYFYCGSQLCGIQ